MRLFRYCMEYIVVLDNEKEWDERRHIPFFLCVDSSADTCVIYDHLKSKTLATVFLFLSVNVTVAELADFVYFLNLKV